MGKVPQEQIPGVYHRRVGDMVVTALSDGFLDGGLDVLRNISEPEARQILYFQAAREQTLPYKQRWRTFTHGEVFPGVTAIPRPGHTPGHTTFLVSSGQQQLLIWGDTVHVPEVQTARPEVCMEFDTDKDAAAVARRRVFDMAASDRLLVTGMHLHFPGFAHLARRGSAFQLIPEPWQQAL